MVEYEDGILSSISSIFGKTRTYNDAKSLFSNDAKRPIKRKIVHVYNGQGVAKDVRIRKSERSGEKDENQTRLGERRDENEARLNDGRDGNESRLGEKHENHSRLEEKGENQSRLGEKYENESRLGEKDETRLGERKKERESGKDMMENPPRIQLNQSEPSKKRSLNSAQEEFEETSILDLVGSKSRQSPPNFQSVNPIAHTNVGNRNADTSQVDDSEEELEPLTSSQFTNSQRTQEKEHKKLEREIGKSEREYKKLEREYKKLEREHEKLERDEKKEREHKEREREQATKQEIVKGRFSNSESPSDDQIDDYSRNDAKVQIYDIPKRDKEFQQYHDIQDFKPSLAIVNDGVMGFHESPRVSEKFTMTRSAHHVSEDGTEGNVRVSEVKPTKYLQETKQYQDTGSSKFQDTKSSKSHEDTGSSKFQDTNSSKFHEDTISCKFHQETHQNKDIAKNAIQASEISPGLNEYRKIENLLTNKEQDSNAKEKYNRLDDKDHNSSHQKPSSTLSNNEFRAQSLPEKKYVTGSYCQPTTLEVQAEQKSGASFETNHSKELHATNEATRSGLNLDKDQSQLQHKKITNPATHDHIKRPSRRAKNRSLAELCGTKHTEIRVGLSKKRKIEPLHSNIKR